MGFWGAGFDTSYETRANPDTLCSPHQVCCKTASIVDRSRTNNEYRLSRHRRLVSLHSVNASRYENGGRHVARVSSAFACLSTYNVHTLRKGFGDMLWVTNHLTPGES